MFTSKIISSVKKELEKINFKYDDIFLIKIKNDKYILEICEDENSYLVIYSEKNTKKYLDNYLLLIENGVKMADIINHTESLIVFENNVSYRFVGNEIMNDTLVNVLKDWYESVHEVNVNCFEDYNNYFNLSNIKTMMNKLNLYNNQAMCYIYSNFDNIKLKLDRLTKGILYFCSSLEDFVIIDDKKLIVIDLENLMYGYRFADVSKMLSMVDKRYCDLFIGDTYTKEEMVIDNVVSCVIYLYIYSTKEIFSERIKKILENVNNGELFKEAKCLVEWY